jgi:hypothetical protein
VRWCQVIARELCCPMAFKKIFEIIRRSNVFLFLDDVLLRLLLVTTLAVHGLASFAGCDPVAAKTSHSGHVIGFGEGSSYEEAKSNALADALQVFGVEISSKLTVTQTSDQVDVLGQNQITAGHEAKGTEVLEFCSVDGNTSKMVVGIKKSLLRSLLLERASARTKHASSNGLTNYDIKILKEAERKDREYWLILGLSLADFPQVIFKDSEKLKGPFMVKADNDLSNQTLPLLLARLKQDGVAVSSTGTELTWYCQTNVGLAIGTVVRFEARCILDENILPLIEVNGMARVGLEQQRAVQLIGNKLLVRALAH